MIKVVFFAALREQLKCNELTLNSEYLSKVADVKQQLANKDEKWQKIFANKTLLSAVNHTMVDDEHTIKAGDEVAFSPPVTGG